MSTIGYQLNILRDTQMVQRRLLEKQFPYIDWARMPFSSYGDFFRLRSIIEDCGEVWTNAYGRSNTEPDGQRNFLEDYSGNGRDIELFNFGYSRQSGFNGYVQDFRNSGSTSIQGSITESKIDVTNIAESASTTWIVWLNKHDYINAPWKVYAEFDAAYAKIIFTNTSDYHTVKNIDLQNGKITEIPALTEEELADYNQVAFAIPKGSHLTLTQIAPYQGAIVGDGVDDYGQCVKDFALPDDYTVVAMRELFNDAGAPIISKSHLRDNGAFILEANSGKTYSYGDENDVNWPKLFSFQTKNIYNGEAITSGTGTDTEEDKLNIFRLREGNSAVCHAALYSFGIFNRTLSEDELRVVENCMYAEWICMTGKLEDIEYYDILDARFRSNEEDADKRNKWVGRLGKLHMTLNNYAYSKMSGWGGWPIKPFSNISQSSGSEATSTKVKVTKIDSNGWVYRMGVSEVVKTQNWRLKIHNPSGKSLSLIYLNPEGISVQHRVPLYEGINIIPLYSEDFSDMMFSMETFSIGEYIEVEQLPLYGGALVSDGVDDNAVSDETIDEEIGGVVVHTEKIGTKNSYVYGGSQGTGVEKSGSLASNFASSLIYMGNVPTITHNIESPYIYGYSREPSAPNEKFRVQNAATSYGSIALYQLRLIKTQPTDIQLEAIKWQCRKEHDDYLIHMGWKEVE